MAKARLRGEREEDEEVEQKEGFCICSEEGRGGTCWVHMALNGPV